MLIYNYLKGNYEDSHQGTVLEVEFNNTKLLKLYETGNSKKYKLEKRVILEFIKAVDTLVAARDIYDLWKYPALNFERLKGSEKLHSVRITKKYRLEFIIDWTNEEQTIGIVGIEEISNHYGGG